MSKTSLLPAEHIERRILLLRGHKVMLDFRLAELYEIPAKVLNQSVKRNIERFPEDFMFQLSEEEALLVMRSQIDTEEEAARREIGFHVSAPLKGPKSRLSSKKRIA